MFDTLVRMSDKRITRADLPSIRQSIGSGGLSPGLVRHLVEEVERLLVERERLVEQIETVAIRWGDVRRILNGLHEWAAGRSSPDEHMHPPP
jgi:hypothetical protein